MTRLTYTPSSYTAASLLFTVLGFMACTAAYAPDPVMRVASAIAVVMCGLVLAQGFLEGEGRFASEPARWCAGAILSVLVGVLQAGVYVGLLSLFRDFPLLASASVPMLTLALAAIPHTTVFASASKQDAVA